LAAHTSKKGENIELGEVSLSGYGKHGKHEGGVHVAYDFKAIDEKKRIKAVVGGIHKLDDKNTLKAKIDQDTNLALSLKHQHSSKFWLTLGTKIQLTDAGNFVTNRLIPIPIGAQLEFFLN